MTLLKTWMNELQASTSAELIKAHAAVTTAEGELITAGSEVIRAKAEVKRATTELTRAEKWAEKMEKALVDARAEEVAWTLTQVRVKTFTAWCEAATKPAEE